MASIGELFGSIFKTIRERPREQPSTFAIPNDQTDLPSSLKTPFARNEHYFQIRVNQLYLKLSRKWLNEIDPLVVVASEFTYDGKNTTVPYVVGPSLIQKFNVQPSSDSLILQNTRVAGLHPYRGGKITLSVMLCEVRRRNNAKALLDIVEGAAGALDSATMLNPYLKIANVVLGGIDSLLGGGETVPLAALRKEIDPDANDRLAPAYFVLIDAPGLDSAKFWVKDNELLYGPNVNAAKPYRDADYVLFSLVRPETAKRSDIELLPFYPLWQRVKAEAASASEDNYKSARSNMLSLYQTLLISPDLTEEQANQLADEWSETMSEHHERAVKFSQRSDAAITAADPARRAFEDARSRALKALKM